MRDPRPPVCTGGTKIAQQGPALWVPCRAYYVRFNADARGSEGLGDFHRRISTSSPEARSYTAMVRFGMWDEIRARTEPDADRLEGCVSLREGDRIGRQGPRRRSQKRATQAGEASSKRWQWRF